MKISDQKPENYFPSMEQKHPGTLASQWVPADTELWKIENYRVFLEARRILLAQAANQFLDSLRHSVIVSPYVPVQSAPMTTIASPLPAINAGSLSEIEDDDWDAFADWAHSVGASRPEIDFELLHSDLVHSPAYADLAWPTGIQMGLSQPAALVVQNATDAQAFADTGFRVFHDAEALRQYIIQIFDEDAST